MRIVSLCVVLFLTFTTAFAQKLSDAEREILTLQDQRSLGAGKLVGYLSNPDEHLRFRAAIALANLQDSSTVQLLLPLLHDASAKVRSATAFALGQIGKSSAQDLLVAKLQIETETSVASRILEALGRCGDEQALDAVVEYQAPSFSAVLWGDRATSVARFALRNSKNERSLWFCFDLLNDSSAEVRWRALFALWRVAPHGLIDVEISKRRDELAKIATDTSPEVRHNFASLLARTKSPDGVELLRKIQQFERPKRGSRSSTAGDWRVQVQIVRAVAALAPTHQELMHEFLEYLASPNTHVKIAALQSLYALPRQLLQESSDSTRLKRAIIQLATKKDQDAELIRGEAFIAMAKFYPDEFNKKNFLTEPNLTIREQTKIIEALSFIPTARSMVSVINHLEHDSVRIAMAAWDFVRKFLTPSTLARMRAGDSDLLELRAMLYDKTLNSLKRGDMAITNLVANALSDTTYFGVVTQVGSRDSLIEALNEGYLKLSSPDDTESMQAVLTAMGRIKDTLFVPTLEQGLKDFDKTVAESAAAALQNITGQDYSSQVPSATTPVHSDYDWETLESIKPGQTAILKTNKGVIKFQLMKEDAPFTVLSFVKLVKKNFYNGLTFHRVVPNFVVQGGDPRGDGWGGPGYAIRSEYSLINYERGSFGIASAGKDTEGCQFFITHLPTPHLDGRYTIFAKVIEGWNVVDNLQVGDVIESITLE